MASRASGDAIGGRGGGAETARGVVVAAGGGEDGVLAQQQGPADGFAGHGFVLGGWGAAVAFIQRIEWDGGEAGAAAALADLDGAGKGAIDGGATIAAERAALVLVVDGGAQQGGDGFVPQVSTLVS